MFQRRMRPDAEGLSRRAGRWLWITLGFDCMGLAWMFGAGSWLDGCSPCRVATLGGHRVVVILLASAGLIMLAVLAPFTEGFTLATPEQRGALAVAGVLSVVAFAGVLSIVLLVGFGALVLRAAGTTRRL
jgi:hypothetical protein